MQSDMKKMLLALALVSGLTANAQIQDDSNKFNHLSVSANIGTMGLGVEVGTTICPIVAVRAGFEMMPRVSVDKTMNFDRPSDWFNYAPIVRHAYLPNDDFSADVRLRLNAVNGKLLFDIYPGKESPFHFTVGTYIGNTTFATVKARGEVLRGVEEFNNDIDNQIPGLGKEKILVDGYELGIDQGRVRASLKTWAFKPYVGIGIGRTVPRTRVGVKFEFGAIFWGTPKLHDEIRGIDVTKDYPGLKGDLYDGIDIGSKVIAYPNLKLSIVGKIF